LHEAGVDLTAVRRLVGLAFQNPEAQLFEQYVGDEIAFGPRQANLSREQVRESVRWAMEQVGLDFDSYKDRFTFGLSGGERKKVALASTLARRPEVLLLDEPMAGLDPRSRGELLAALRRLIATGMTLVLSTHQMEDLAALAQRVTVMSKGRDALNGPVEQVFANAGALRAVGLEPPVVTRIADALWERGWPLPAGLVEPGTLARAVQAAAQRERA
jgi:energy-coupling factor transport system ATP-binding protein